MKSLRFRVIGFDRSGQSSLRKYLSERYHIKVESSESSSSPCSKELQSYDRIFLITIRKGFIKSLKATNTTLEATSQSTKDIDNYINERIQHYTQHLGERLCIVELDEMIKNPNFPHMNKR